MGFGKELKKAGKKLWSAASSPWNLINPLASVGELGNGVYTDYQNSKAEDKAKRIAEEQAVIDASNNAFDDELDRKRRTSQKSNVIFAGVLGDSEKIGLGGQKSLLGL